MDILTSVPAMALIIGAILALIALLALELIAVRRMNGIMGPAMEYARAKAEEEAEHILATARENARALIMRAEASTAALAAERTQEDEARVRAHKEVLRDTREAFERSLVAATEGAQAAALEARDALTKEIAALGENAKKDLAAATHASAETFATHLADMLTEARNGAKAYQEARERSVEEHIRELVAETTKLVLGRGLPEEATAELVRRALEEAKAAHAL